MRLNELRTTDVWWPAPHLPVVIAASALLVALTLLAVEGHWKWLAGATGGVAVLGLLLLRPATCLLLLFAWLPFQSLLNDVLARFTSLVAVGKDVLMAMLIASLVGHHFLRRRAWYVNAPMYWLAAFALTATLAALTAPDVMRGVLQLRFLLLYPALLVVAANALESTADLQRLLRWLALVGLVTVAYGLLQYFTNFDVPYRTSGGDVALRMGRFDDMAIVSTFASRPAFGGWLVAIFLLLLNVGQLGKRLSGRLTRRAALLGTLLCIVLTYSRTTWLALLIGGLVTLWLKNKTKALLCVLALGGAFTLFFATQFFQVGASLHEAATSSESMEVRLGYWPLVLRHVVANPLGLGLGTVGGPHLFEAGAQADAYGNLQYDPFASFDPQAELGPNNSLMVTDNTFLKLLVQGGFPLLLAFLGMLGATVQLLARLLRQTPAGWQRELLIWIAGCFAALLTIFMFVDFLESGPPIALYWLALGLLCWLKQNAECGVRSV